MDGKANTGVSHCGDWGQYRPVPVCALTPRGGGIR